MLNLSSRGARLPCLRGLTLSMCASVLLSLYCVAPSSHGAATPEETMKRVALNTVGERPDPEGTPTPVATTVYVLDINYIDDVSQSVTVDFILRLRWRDPRLIDNKGPSEVRQAALDDVWNPKMRVLNPRNLSKQLPDTVDIDAQGFVTHRQRFLGELAVPLDLKEFPFDEELLSIQVVSAAYSSEEVALVADKIPSAKADRLSVSGWSIGPGTTSVGSLRVPILDNDLALFSYDLSAQRQLGFYVWKVLVPLTLIVFMSYAVFWIDPANIGAQIGISTASILTLIAFYLHLSNVLPPVPFPTRLDDFILGATVLVFFAFGEGITTSILARDGYEATALKIDLWMRWIFPLCFASIMFVLFVA